jgi:MtN3 and saliva related transmembrane protein
MFDEYIGLAGMALLILAWIPETRQNWRERGQNLSLNFVCLYLFGALFLAYHAYRINDGVFLLLNALAALIALFNAAIILTRPKTGAGIESRRAKGVLQAKNARPQASRKKK